ncbi:30S ribosomal protein S4 [Candidatus Falkowbacteria bacterium RIFOXYC2_FULL_48_21]|uniref:Small ribosomal subunit protein uS4 n=1 Tax=Candidatus Falkowbacteria bacterium RIFOXYC2_FULL_48_21 TaxID=1798005 RepID=A0A1F5TDA0_9BACT|nr:MAG: 30S ribosomal protein S4 [Candidatus Falkowbacteria bacterium RIFOXYC2_FULL_48_21]
MARDTNPQCKRCRRMGAKLFLKGDRCNTSKCAMVKRNYAPGAHGQKAAGGKGGRMTGYGMQLREKQKAKATYGILERQMRRYYDTAIRTKGDTSDILFKILESRFDNVVFRAGFAVNRQLARQLVNHNHFAVNGKRVNIPSYAIQMNDKITIDKTSAQKVPFKDLSEKLKTSREVTDWLSVDAKDLVIAKIGEPSMQKAAPNYDIRQIIEFYSR